MNELLPNQEDFIAWLKEQPQDKKYDQDSTCGCVLHDYFTEKGPRQAMAYYIFHDTASGEGSYYTLNEWQQRVSAFGIERYAELRDMGWPEWMAHDEAFTATPAQLLTMLEGEQESE